MLEAEASGDEERSGQRGCFNARTALDSTRSFVLAQTYPGRVVLHKFDKGFDNVNAWPIYGEAVNAAQKRFTRACETLARVRKLSRNTPALPLNIATKGGLQLNIATKGGQQVNVAQ